MNNKIPTVTPNPAAEGKPRSGWPDGGIQIRTIESGETENAVAPSGTESASLPAGKNRAVIAGAMVTALITLCFMLLFWNRFVGLRSGDGGFSGGVFFLKGVLPYRDYFAPTPPLFVLRCAAVLAAFGKLPIILRGFAVFERVILSLLVYGWLARFFRAKDAALAAVVTIVLSTGDFADPVSSYNHFTILLAVATGFAASYALDEGRTRRALLAIGALTGVLSLLCLATKQTIGLGVTLAIPAALGLCLIRLDSASKAVKFLAGFAAGWLLAAGVLLAWMAHAGILHAFLIQAFVTAPAAKASHFGDFAVRSLMVVAGLWWAALIALAVLLLYWRVLRRAEHKNPMDSAPDSLSGILPVLLLGLVSIGAATIVTWRMVGFLLNLHLPPGYVLLQNLPTKPVIYISLLGSGLLILDYLWLLLCGKLSRRQSQFGLFATIAFISAFMTSLSWPAFEAMIVPGLGLILAVFLSEFEGWRRWVVYAACGVLMFSTALFKEGMPFGFDGWFEPPARAANTASSLPELRGFLLPPETVDFVDSTVRIIRGHSTPKDTIFIYPELGFFYGATERRPATFSASHNIDVVPDSFAREEAQRLLQARPAVLIYGPQMEQSLLGGELYWRFGKPSGQRDLIAAVETLARQYRLIRMFRMYPYNLPVYVFVRPDAVGVASMTAPTR